MQRVPSCFLKVTVLNFCFLWTQLSFLWPVLQCFGDGWSREDLHDNMHQQQPKSMRSSTALLAVLMAMRTFYAVMISKWRSSRLHINGNSSAREQACLSTSVEDCSCRLQIAKWICGILQQASRRCKSKCKNRNSSKVELFSMSDRI